MVVIHNSWKSGTDLSQVMTMNGEGLLSSQPVWHHTISQTSSQSTFITSASEASTERELGALVTLSKSKELRL